MQNLNTPPILLQGLAESTGIRNSSFNPDRSLFAVGGNQQVLLWDVNADKLIDKVCQAVGRNFARAEWTQYFPGEEYRSTCQQWPLEPEPTSTPTP